jgi:hypothetical protein
VDYKNTERKIIIKNSLRSDKIKTMVNRFKNHCLNSKLRDFNQLNIHHSDMVVYDLVKYSTLIVNSTLMYIKSVSLGIQKILTKPEQQKTGNLMFQILILSSIIGSIIITIEVIILIIIIK